MNDADTMKVFFVALMLGVLSMPVLAYFLTSWQAKRQARKWAKR